MPWAALLGFAQWVLGLLLGPKAPVDPALEGEKAGRAQAQVEGLKAEQVEEDRANEAQARVDAGIAADPGRLRKPDGGSRPWTPGQVE